MTPRLLALVLVLTVGRPVWAQTRVVSDEPVSVTVALMGVVVTAAGFGMMLRQDERGSSDTGWLIGGVAVVGAGVTMTYLGLRSHTVTVAPVIGKQFVGGLVVVRWPPPSRRRGR